MNSTNTAGKTALSLFLCIALLLSSPASLVALAAGTAQLVMQDQEASVNDNVTVTVSLQNNPGISGFQLDISFDNSKLEYVNGVARSGDFSTTSINKNSDSTCRAVWYSPNLSNVTTSGSLIDLTFRVKDGSGSSANISVTCKASDNKGGSINVQSAQCKINIKSSQVNNDNSNDIVAEGTCGNGVTWKLDKSGVLTIGGSGPMEDYDDGYPSPWRSYADQVKSLRVENSVTHIGDLAFFGCTELTDAYISGSVKSIGEFAFQFCSKLKNVSLSEGLETIEAWAFHGCNMANITLPASITRIDGWAFCACYSLTEITIPEKVTNISAGTFSACSGLKSVHVSQNVTSIGTMAFAECDNLTDVYYSGSESQWKQIAIDNTDGYNAPLLNATIHYGIDDSINSTTFTDVPSDAYYYDAVMWAIKNNITYGMSDTKFAPDSTVTRAQAVTFLYRAFGNGVTTSGSTKFNDVDSDAWYVDAIAWAVARGITNGTSSTTFSPNASVTYVQMLAFLARANGEECSGAAWEIDAAKWARNNGVTEGIDSYSAHDPCPRRDVVYTMYRTADGNKVDNASTSSDTQTKQADDTWFLDYRHD